MCVLELADLTRNISKARLPASSALVLQHIVGKRLNQRKYGVWWLAKQPYIRKKGKYRISEHSLSETVHIYTVMHSTNCVACWLVIASTMPATSAKCETQCPTNTFCRRWQNLTMLTHPTYQKCVGTFGIRSGISSLQRHTLADLTPAVQTLL